MYYYFNSELIDSFGQMPVLYKENTVQNLEALVELTAKEAKDLIEKFGPKLGYETTSDPIFPAGCKTVCVIKHTTENGTNYGYDVVYVVWKDPNGEVKYEEVKDTRSTRDYMNVYAVEIYSDGSLVVDFRKNGKYDGKPWDNAMSETLKDANARPAPTAQTYLQAATEAMRLLAEQNMHPHPLYLSTRITESVVQEDQRIAVCILFEQIDTDRMSVDGEGTLGDQFRYSVFQLNDKCELIHLHEDHAYIRPRTRNEITGTRGRDCTLKNLRLEGDFVRVQHLKGDRFEHQVWKDLRLDLVQE